MASREVQAILQEIRKHIEQRYSSIQEAFLKVDTDRSNSITGDELATIFKVHNVKVHPRVCATNQTSATTLRVDSFLVGLSTLRVPVLVRPSPSMQYPPSYLGTRSTQFNAMNKSKA